MCKDMTHYGARIDAVYFCPHHPLDNCECRKPKNGMFLEAGIKINIDYLKSYVIGDSISDLVAGASLGCKTVLVRTGYGSKEEGRICSSSFKPDFVANDLLEATRWITK